MAQRIADGFGSPAAFMLRWARELVVDRTVLVYAPPLHERMGSRLGPVQLFAELDDALGSCRRLDREQSDTEQPVRRCGSGSFPKGGFRMCQPGKGPLNRRRPQHVFLARHRRMSPYTSHSERASLLWP